MTDDLLGLARRLDQAVEIDPGLDAEFEAHVHEVLGRYVAGRALETAIGTTAEATDRRVEIVYAHLHRGERVAEAEPARVVQMQIDALVRPAITHETEHAPHRERRCPAHRV